MATRIPSSYYSHGEPAGIAHRPILSGILWLSARRTPMDNDTNIAVTADGNPPRTKHPARRWVTRDGRSPDLRVSAYEPAFPVSQWHDKGSKPPVYSCGGSCGIGPRSANRTAFPITPITGPSLGRILRDGDGDAIVFGFFGHRSISNAWIDSTSVSRLVSYCGDAKQLVFGNTVRPSWQFRNCPRNCDRGVFCS